MNMVRIKSNDIALPDQDRHELGALADKPDSEIDFCDMPKLNPAEWNSAVRGKFYKPVKQPITIRVDSDVLSWLKSFGSGYQTRINNILRKEMIASFKQD